MTINKSTQDQLRQIVEQIERLEEENRAIAEDVRDKYLEAKSMGFDVKILRHVIKLRKVSKDERDEAQAVLDTYLHALGMLADTPLGDYAMRVHAVARAHGIQKDIADQVVAETAGARA